MTIYNALAFALGLDTSGIDSGLIEAQRKIEIGARSLSQALLSPFKAALGQIAAGLSFAAITRQYLDQADAIGKMADSIGVDIQELQAWGEAAKRAGGSTEAFQGTVQSLTRNLQMAATNAKGPAAQALRELGVKTTDVKGKARDTFEVLRDLAGKMEGMDKQKALAFGQRIGIDRGTIMLLQKGKISVEELVKRMKELGGYTSEDAKIAGEAKDAIADLGTALKSGAALIMLHVVPAITWVTRKMTEAVQLLKRHKPFVIATLGAIAALLSVKLIPELITWGKKLKDTYGPMFKIAAIAALIALALDDLWVYMHGGESEFEDFWKKFGTGPELLEKFNKAVDKTKEVFKAIEPYIEPVTGTIIALLAALGAQTIVEKAMKIGKAIKLIGGAFASVFKTLAKNPILLAISLIIIGIAAIIKNWDKIQKGFDETVKTLKQWKEDVTKVWDDFVEEAGKVWERIKKLFSWEEWKKTLTDIFADFDFEKFKNDFIDALKDAWDKFLEYMGITGKGGLKDRIENPQRVPDNLLRSPSGKPLGILEQQSYTPSPADAAHSQAVTAASFTQNTDNSSVYNDNRNTSVVINSTTDDPERLARQAERAVDRRPRWMPQSANGVNFA